METKGYFSKEDRRKHIIIKETRPDLDIRFCFQNSKTKLSKAKKSLTYGQWCDRHGFLYCDKTIPNDWYDEIFPQKTDDPEQGDVCFDEEKNCWVIYNGEEWIDITKKKNFFSSDTW